MLVSDRAHLVGLWGVFRDQVEIGFILGGRHREVRLLDRHSLGLLGMSAKDKAEVKGQGQD